MYKKSHREKKIEKAENETWWYAIKRCGTVFLVLVILFIFL